MISVIKLYPNFRSSRLEVFCKKGALRNLAKFTGKYLCQSIFLNKVPGLRPATLLENRLWHRCFPVNFLKLLLAASETFHYFEKCFFSNLNFQNTSQINPIMTNISSKR